METLFNKPQKQSIKGILIMFTDSVQSFVRAAWLPLVLIIYKLDTSKIILFGLGLLILLVCIGVVAYIQHNNFTFFLDKHKNEFVIQKGVITKNKIIIQLDKIQQVNINQSLIQKLVGVYSLDIDTAGSNKKEISIRAIDYKIAQHLKESLLNNEVKAVDQEIEGFKTPEKPFLKLSFLTLLKVGLTSNYSRSFVLIGGFVASFYGGIQDVSKSIDIDKDQIDGYVEQGINYFSISFLLMIVLIIVLVINIVRTVVKHFDFQITKQNKTFAITFGLIAKKNTLLKPSKVQITSFSQNYFQKKLDIQNIILKQASTTDETETNNKKSDIEIPGCNKLEKEAVLNLLFTSKIKEQEVLTPNYRYIVKAVFLSIIIPVSLFIIAGLFINQELQSYFGLILVYLIMVGVVLFFKFKNYRLYLNNEFLIFKRNAWDVEHLIIEPFKIQGITTRQYFWHKKANVGHVIFHTAAGDVNFKYANFLEIKKWTNYWLYAVESSNKNWM